MQPKKESLGIKKLRSVHLFTSDMERYYKYYVETLGFVEVASSDESYENQNLTKVKAFQAGEVSVVILSPLHAGKGECGDWLELHPDGVGRVVFEVQDIEHVWYILTSRGATPTSGVNTYRSDSEQCRWFDIVTPLGDTLFRFIETDNTSCCVPGLLEQQNQCATSNELGISTIDHITSNFKTLKPALLWMEHVMGFETYWDIKFHTSDITNQRNTGSGLASVVMRCPECGMKFANNEPAAPFFKNSQIYTFCHDNRGSGIQHIALNVTNIVEVVSELKSQGVKLMSTPSSYYQMLPSRLKELGIGRIEEEIAELEKHGILVDGHGDGQYLLQIFTHESASLFNDPQAGPLFLELIERKGDQGFGAGNFRALFESIEREQSTQPQSASV